MMEKQRTLKGNQKQCQFCGRTATNMNQHIVVCQKAHQKGDGQYYTNNQETIFCAHEGRFYKSHSQHIKNKSTCRKAQERNRPSDQQHTSRYAMSQQMRPVRQFEQTSNFSRSNSSHRIEDLLAAPLIAQCPLVIRSIMEDSDLRKIDHMVLSLQIIKKMSNIPSQLKGQRNLYFNFSELSSRDRTIIASKIGSITELSDKKFVENMLKTMKQQGQGQLANKLVSILIKIKKKHQLNIYTGKIDTNYIDSRQKQSFFYSDAERFIYSLFRKGKRSYCQIGIIYFLVTSTLLRKPDLQALLKQMKRQYDSSQNAEWKPQSIQISKLKRYGRTTVINLPDQLWKLVLICGVPEWKEFTFLVDRSSSWCGIRYNTFRKVGIEHFYQVASKKNIKLDQAAMRTLMSATGHIRQTTVQSHYMPNITDQQQELKAQIVKMTTIPGLLDAPFQLFSTVSAKSDILDDWPSKILSSITLQSPSIELKYSQGDQTTNKWISQFGKQVREQFQMIQQQQVDAQQQQVYEQLSNNIGQIQIQQVVGQQIQKEKRVYTRKLLKQIKKPHKVQMIEQMPQSWSWTTNNEIQVDQLKNLGQNFIFSQIYGIHPACINAQAAQGDAFLCPLCLTKKSYYAFCQHCSKSPFEQVHIFMKSPEATILVQSGVSANQVTDRYEQFIVDQRYNNNKSIHKSTICFFLNQRGFFYVQTSTMAVGLQPTQMSYMHYAQARFNVKPIDYFPPVYMYFTGRKGSFGDDVGLKALQDLPIGTFIGQYACDIMRQQCSYLVKKKDSIVSLQNGWILGPRDHCNHIPLLNTSSQPNLSVHSCHQIINGRIKLVFLLKTNRLVRAEQQLNWDYGQGYNLAAFS